jgi:hypothetical protein
MIIGEGLPFIKDYVSALNAALKKQNGSYSLSRIQCYWLSFVILGILITNTLCWKRFEKFSIGSYRSAAICWIFRKAKIAWELLLKASVSRILESYSIKSCVLVIDDTDNERSRTTSEIAKVHKIKDKKSSGYFNGQNIVFLLLVSNELTIPVGFEFYEPDPQMVLWRKEDKRLREKGVEKKYRPQKPSDNPDYPGKKSLGLKLLEDFMKNFESIKIKATVADNFYSTREFIDGAARLTKQPQVISQIKKSQLINVNGKNISIGNFFENYYGHTEEIKMRFNQKIITHRSGKFKVKSHGKKYYIIALKYEGESEYRYLIANDMSWRDIDIIKTFSLRWLVEVFIQDWKSYEGWHQLAKQRGIEGSERGLTLSLLCDHALHFHQDQLVLFKNKEPAITVGSLREKTMMESLSTFIKNIIENEDPKAMFEKYANNISQMFELRSSIKHMRGIDFEIT